MQPLNPSPIRTVEVTEPGQTARLIGELVTLFRRSMETWGPRMADILTYALFSLAERGLTLYELRPFLTDDDYRERVLAEPVSRPLLDPLTAQEVRDFWTDEFARFSPGERAAAVNPVLNKVRDLVRQPYLRRLVCQGESTLDFQAIMVGRPQAAVDAEIQSRRQAVRDRGTPDGRAGSAAAAKRKTRKKAATAAYQETWHEIALRSDEDDSLE